MEPMTFLIDNARILIVTNNARMTPKITQKDFKFSSKLGFNDTALKTGSCPNATKEKKEKIISENNTWTKELDEILNAKDSLKKLHPANNEEEQIQS